MDTPNVGQNTGVQGQQPLAPTQGNSRVTQSMGPSIASRIAALVKAGMNLTDKTNATQHTVTQNSPEIGVANTPAGRMSSAIDGCRDIVTGCDGSKKAAKVVYENLGDILEAIKSKIGDDFSADGISRAFDETLGKSALPLAGNPGTVGRYDPGIDGTERRKDQVKTEQGYSAPYVWTEDPKAKAQAHGECMSRCTEAGLKSGREKNPKNVKIDEDFLRKFQKGTVGVNIGGHHPYRISWPKDFDVSAYSGQIAYESNTFSGDVKIHKLEPGTVLVRVFGKGQSVKAPCWARLDDDSSSVTCAADLYKKLAVKAEWNADGNLGIFIVPEGADVWVAEGKIASQLATYKGNVKVNGEDVQQEQSFLYEGGGTQVNILTPNPPEQSQVEGPVGPEDLEHPEKSDLPPLAYETFAGVYPDVFEKCMFCFRNDGIMEPKEQGPKTQS